MEQPLSLIHIYRPERAKPFPKRVVVFSPHPDDEAISMGGTLRRLVQQGDEVHVAYETSGNIAAVSYTHLKAMEKIHGLIDAPFTPFYENGEVNYEPIEAYCQLLVRNGLQGVFINGSSGEGYMLTEEMCIRDRFCAVTETSTLLKPDL